MKKIRLIRTTVVEYEPNAECYPEGFTIEQMAELDSKHEDSYMLFEESLDEITYEIIEK